MFIFNYATVSFALSFIPSISASNIYMRGMQLAWNTIVYYIASAIIRNTYQMLQQSQWILALCLTIAQNRAEIPVRPPRIIARVRCKCVSTVILAAECKLRRNDNGNAKGAHFIGRLYVTHTRLDRVARFPNSEFAVRDVLQQNSVDSIRGTGTE